MNRLLAVGLRELFGGARRGQPALAGLGAALAIVGFVRRFRRADKDLLSEYDLKEGESLKISFLRGHAVVASSDVDA